MLVSHVRSIAGAEGHRGRRMAAHNLLSIEMIKDKQITRASQWDWARGSGRYSAPGVSISVGELRRTETTVPACPLCKGRERYCKVPPRDPPLGGSQISLQQILNLPRRNEYESSSSDEDEYEW